MLPARFQKKKHPQNVFNDVMGEYVYFENGKEKISASGMKILKEWGKMHGMSFNNKTYLIKYREDMKERIGLSLKIDACEKKEILFSKAIHPKPFRYPQRECRSYASYFAEWSAKRTFRPLSEILKKMREDRKYRGLKNIK